jgi:hypothetical protein
MRESLRKDFSYFQSPFGKSGDKNFWLKNDRKKSGHVAYPPVAVILS